MTHPKYLLAPATFAEMSTVEKTLVAGSNMPTWLTVHGVGCRVKGVGCRV